MSNFLESFYPYTPVWLQNLGISIYGLFYCRERLGGEFDSFVEDFKEREDWSPVRMEDYLTRELRKILRMAFREVPYYRETWSKLGLLEADLASITPQTLSRLPVAKKEPLRRDPHSFVSERIPRRRYKIYHSSGSTGTPVSAICTARDRRRFYAAREARSFNWADVSIRMPRSMIGGRMVVPDTDSRGPFFRHNWAERQLYFSAFHISPPNIQAYVQALNRYQPPVMTGYASAHYFLAKMMRDQDLTLRYQPQAIILGSEKLTPEMKKIIQDAFQARAYEEYGAVENCMLGTECEYGRLHIHPDFGIVEIIKEDGQPAAPGEVGRILCTGLLNHTQPLVRYEIGDLGVWSGKSCPCGRNHLPVLEELVGRMEDAIIGPDGREMVRFHGIFIDLPHVIEGQIVQETRSDYIVNIVPAEGFGDPERQQVVERMRQRLGKDIRVRVELLEDIPRTRAGKYPAVVSHLE